MHRELEEDTGYLLEDYSGNILYKGDPCSIRLSEHGFEYRRNRSTSERWSTVPIDDIIGAGPEEGPTKRYCHFYVYIYERPETGCFPSSGTGPSGDRVAKHRSFAFNFEDQDTSVKQCMTWSYAVQRVSRKEPLEWEGDLVSEPKRRKYLCIVNPVGGKGNAMSIFHCTVMPMLVQANFAHELIPTERAGHATEIVKNLVLEDYHCIVVVGGDGLIYEVINGLAARPDSAEALTRIPIAAIPGGSGNGLAQSVMHESGEEFSDIDAMYIAIKGKPVPFDLSQYSTADGMKHVSFLSLGWGLVSDVDIRTEPYRWMGDSRFTLGGIYFIMKHRNYPARISMLLADQVKSSGDDEELSPYVPSLQDPVDNRWTVIEGNFVFFWAVQTSHASRNMYSGPGAHLSDGKFTIFLIREANRANLAQLLLGLDSGEHINHPSVERFSARAFRIEPSDNTGLYSLDGEVVPYGPIQGVVWPSAARIMATATLAEAAHHGL